MTRSSADAPAAVHSPYLDQVASRRNLPVPLINFVYRGRQIDIDIVDCKSSWSISIEVTPFDGVELIEPIGTRLLKLAKGDELNDIKRILVAETRLAVDHRLVGR